MKLRFFVFITLSITSLSVFADGKGFYERKAEGWFFYQIEPEVGEELKEEIKKQPIIVVSKQAQLPVSKSDKVTEDLSAAWFRENMQKIKDDWWNNPTVENARVFAYMQRFMLDRSEQAQQAYEMATLGDPYLDEVSRRPTATFAAAGLDEYANQERKKLLSELSTQVGIFFFYDSNCEMCELQSQIISYLKSNYGFSVVAISKDGKPFKNNLYPNYKVDNGHAKRLGILTYPSTFLVSSNGKFAPIVQGVTSLPDTLNRILISAKKENWITQEQLDKTRPIINISQQTISEVVAKKIAEINKSKIQSQSHNVTKDSYNDK